MKLNDLLAKFKRCALCPSKLDKNYAVVQLGRVKDVLICTKCADKMDTYTRENLE